MFLYQLFLKTINIHFESYSGYRKISEKHKELPLFPHSLSPCLLSVVHLLQFVSQCLKILLTKVYGLHCSQLFYALYVMKYNMVPSLQYHARQLQCPKNPMLHIVNLSSFPTSFQQQKIFSLFPQFCLFQNVTELESYSVCMCVYAYIFVAS